MEHGFRGRTERKPCSHFPSPHWDGLHDSPFWSWIWPASLDEPLKASRQLLIIRPCLPALAQ
jgi:hypothetical protein